METVLQSRSRTVTIGAGLPFCIIGERINPTGRKTFAEQLRGGDLSTVTADALAQVSAGADVLDINATCCARPRTRSTFRSASTPR
jgi:5-methyltetrahydrofolate--homocysteine methyltransferase